MADLCLDLTRCHTVEPYACAARWEPGTVIPRGLTKVTYLDDMYFTGDCESSFFDRHDSVDYDCPQGYGCRSVYLGQLVPPAKRPMRGHWRITVEFVPAVERPSGVCLPPSHRPWPDCSPKRYTDADVEGEPPRERCLRIEAYVATGGTP